MSFDIAIGSGVPGGMGGGAVAPELWVHPKLQQYEAAIRNVLLDGRSSFINQSHNHDSRQGKRPSAVLLGALVARCLGAHSTRTLSKGIASGLWQRNC